MIVNLPRDWRVDAGNTYVVTPSNMITSGYGQDEQNLLSPKLSLEHHIGFFSFSFSFSFFIFHRPACSAKRHSGWNTSHMEHNRQRDPGRM
jgi:hypothetical protein